MATLKQLHLRIQQLCENDESVAIDAIASEFKENKDSITYGIDQLVVLGIIAYAKGDVNEIILTEWGKLWSTVP